MYSPLCDLQWLLGYPSVHLTFDIRHQAGVCQVNMACYPPSSHLLLSPETSTAAIALLQYPNVYIAAKRITRTCSLSTLETCKVLVFRSEKVEPAK
jgi:hypothetical protein